jgi:hypothetical protein
MGSSGKPGMARFLVPVFDFGVFLSGVLPVGVGDWICRRGGDLAFSMLGSRRRVTAGNMAGVTGKPAADLEVQRLASPSELWFLLVRNDRYSHLSTQEMLDRVTA